MFDDKKLEKTINEFISMVSHDLRTPLSAIHLSAELISKDAPLDSNGERIKYRVNIIQRQISSMVRMISTLLDAEKIGAGKLPIAKVEADATRDLLEVLDEFIPIAAAHNVLVDVVIPERPLLAVYDKDRIRQVLGNLVGNALKFAKEKTKCTLLVKKDKTGRDWIQFEVSNIGDVIPQNKRETIFERFDCGGCSQGQTTIASGLGLWIARWIVETHGGKIWVEPMDNGTGNVFCFTLPRYSSADLAQV